MSPDPDALPETELIQSTDWRHLLISEAAYLRYIERGRVDGFDLDDWFAAEAEVDRVIAAEGQST